MSFDNLDTQQFASVFSMTLIYPLSESRVIDACIVIAQKQFENRYIREAIPSELIRELLLFSINDYKNRRMDNLEVILGRTEEDE